jgi:hypothetical protein
MNPAECQATIPFESVPSQLGRVESFAGHGLYRIAEDRFHLPDFYPHAQWNSQMTFARGSFTPRSHRISWANDGPFTIDT